MIIGKPILTGGSGGIVCTYTLITAAGATVTATLGEKTAVAVANANGVAVLKLRAEGTWTITATLGDKTKSTTVEVSHNMSAEVKFFPLEPSSYDSLALITANQTWVAPEDGWFQVEVFGASGSGGAAKVTQNEERYWGTGGGGGGGGGCASSRIKMMKGDSIIITCGSVGKNSVAVIHSSLENYSALTVTSGANGTDATGVANSVNSIGHGGAGGVASGGNFTNMNGGAGGNGKYGYNTPPEIYELGIVYNQVDNGGDSGSAGCVGGNNGGAGGHIGAYTQWFIKEEATYWAAQVYNSKSGLAGFVKIYRGNTNIVEN